MQRIVLVLLGMASLVASGVIMDRGRLGLYPGLGLQTNQGMKTGNVGIGNTLSQNELLRQKFILDILHQVYKPLQQRELLMLEDGSIIANEDLYVRPLTQEMQMVLNMIRSNQLTGKQTIPSINNEEQMLQMVGLYRLLVSARDFETFKRLAVHARQNMNTEIFVNTLILSLGERSDTHMLVVPALNEILPQLFIEDDVVERIQQLDTGVSSIRPQILDIVGMRRKSPFMNSGIAQQQEGLLGVLNRSQLWLPWRDLHRQMAVRKMVDGNVVQQTQSGMDKLVIDLPGQGLLSQDMDLKAYVNILVDELIVNQDVLKGSTGSQLYGSGRLESVQNSLRGDYIPNTGRDSIVGGGLDSERLLYVGHRQRGQDWGTSAGVRQNLYTDSIGGRNQDMDSEYRNRDTYGAGRMSQDLEYDTERSHGILGSKRLGRMELERDNVYVRGGRGQLLGGHYVNIEDADNLERMEEQRGINTVSSNDARLLFLGRRRKSPHSVSNLAGGIDEDDSMISGGRRVSNEDQRVKDKYQKYRYEKDDEDYQTKYDNKRWEKQSKQGMEERQGGRCGKHTQDGTGRCTKERMQGKYSDDDEVMGSVYNSRRFDKEIDNDMDVNTMYDIRRLGQNNYQQGNEYQSSRYGKYDSMDHLANQQRYINVYGRQSHDNDDEDLPWLLNRNLNVNSGYQGYRQGYGYGRGRDQFLNIVHGGKMGQSRPLHYGESLDQNLPTTTIDDERLLHVNRRKLTGNDVLESNDYYGQNMRQGNDMDITSHGYQTRPSYSELYGRGEENRGYLGEEISRGRRQRRSLVDQDIEQDSNIDGKLLLHNLQQLVARLNIERIALGMPQLLDDSQISSGSGRGLIGQITQRLSTIRGNIRGVLGGAVQSMEKIGDIIHRIDQVLAQKIKQISSVSYNKIVNDIGLLVAGQIEEGGLLDIICEVLKQGGLQQRGQVANIIENEAVQVLLAGIVKVVDQRIQQIFQQRQEFISNVPDIQIQQVDIDPLKTYLEYDEIDLTNLLPQSISEQTQQGQGQGRQVVGRVARLNHKDFKVGVIVNSQRPQQVVVRQMLVPKVDGRGNIIPLEQRRQNVIVLDIATVHLQAGQNKLQFRSNDITMTAPDTTPLTQIYQQVMQALNGEILLQRQQLVGQTNKLPHHLLLPRGSLYGLPMQLITVVTPVETTGISQNGLDALLRDGLPLNYPLHCDITDLDRVNSMPNLIVKDVKIYHEDKIGRPLMSSY